MNRNITAIILIVLAIGIFFTVTDSQYQKVKVVQAKNAEYKDAVESSVKLLAKRDALEAIYASIPPADITRLNKIIPDSVDNVRLIIDMNGIAARRGLVIRNVSTSESSKTATSDKTPQAGKGQKADSVTISFSVTTSYENFIALLRDIEANLRLMEVSRFSFSAGDSGNYDFSVELKTYWLRQ